MPANRNRRNVNLETMNTVFFWINAAITLLGGALFLWLPRLTRKAFLFGVRVPEAAHETPEAQALLRRYRLNVAIGVLLMLALEAVQYIVAPQVSLLACMFFPLLLVAVQMAAFVPCWRRALRLKAEKGWPVTLIVQAETRSAVSRGNLSAVPWGWYIAGLVLVIGTIIASLAVYPTLPSRIPTHFGFDGQPDAWSNTSIGTVLAMPLVNLGLLALMAVSGIMVVKTKLQVSPENPALSFAQHRRYRSLMGHCMGFCTLCLIVMCAFISLPVLWPGTTVSAVPILLISGAACAPLIIVGVKVGQGGCRLKPVITPADAMAAGFDPATATSPSVPGRDDDRFWVLGMFYRNPQDPALLVEDRFGTNVGFNYARTGVKVGVAVLALLIIGVYVWTAIAVLPLI